jgi:hypothetical protein
VPSPKEFDKRVKSDIPSNPDQGISIDLDFCLIEVRTIHITGKKKTKTNMKTEISKPLLSFSFQ